MVHRQSYIAAKAVLLAGCLLAAALTSRASDWEPLGLVGLLAALALISDALTIETRAGQRLSGSFLAIVLAMALCGPAPAVVIALLTILVDALRSRPALTSVVVNLATYAAFPLAGGLLVHWGLSEGVDDSGFSFGLLVLGVYAVTIVLNFALTALGFRVMQGIALRRQVREILLPILPAELAAGTLVLAFGVVYTSAGTRALAVLIIALVAFQFLTRALLVSQERAEQLAARTTELASLQVGVLAALVHTLSLRDKMTARHSAAVARYSRAIAEEVGCGEAERDLVHTAALLHDIGKFIFPDHILFANRKLSDADWEVVHRHPAQGARVVSRVAGYGPVADIIRFHHERIDGRGYPDGLAGSAIPRLSRMIAVADTYDVMTARDSYRTPVSAEDAVAELRRVAGTQLDGELVEAFVSILDRRSLAFQHTTDADFEAELDFEARVRAFSAT